MEGCGIQVPRSGKLQSNSELFASEAPKPITLSREALMSQKGSTALSLSIWNLLLVFLPRNVHSNGVVVKSYDVGDSLESVDKSLYILC